MLGNVSYRRIEDLVFHCCISSLRSVGPTFRACRDKVSSADAVLHALHMHTSVHERDAIRLGFTIISEAVDFL
jgi:hypothetical protein